MLQPDKDIFHITAETNLQNIFRSGGLFCKNSMRNNYIAHADIAYQSAQATRAIKQVPVFPNGVLHDYVPFYFAPRSPMLYAVHTGSVEGCSYRQDQIVHLVSSVNRVVHSRIPFVFYNYCATCLDARAFNDLIHFGEIDWPLFYGPPTLDGYCKFWKDDLDNPRWLRRKATRGAEFLAYQSLPLCLVFQIGVANAAALDRVAAMCQGVNRQIPVGVKSEWYY